MKSDGLNVLLLSNGRSIFWYTQRHVERKYGEQKVRIIFRANGGAVGYRVVLAGIASHKTWGWIEWATERWKPPPPNAVGYAACPSTHRQVDYDDAISDLLCIQVQHQSWKA